MATNMTTKVVKGAFWAFMEKICTQLVGFFITIVLARLLSPADYGVVAIISIFIAVANVLADSGLGGALIQRKNATDIDFNSVFYASVVLSLALYGILFISAPYIARFYDNPELVSILRVLAVTVIFNSINSVQNATLSKELKFHLSFRISLISILVSGIVGVCMAFGGYGAWALVVSVVASGFVGVVSRWILIAWRPRLRFSFQALKSLFQYGWKISASVLIDTFYNNIYGLIVGKCYSSADLAFVNKGRHLPQIFMETISITLSKVAFPVLANMQDDPNRLVSAMRRMIRTSTYFVFPLMAIAAATAKPIVLILYGEKWLPLVPYMQLYCFSFALWPFHTINLQAIEALGRSDLFLKLEIIKKAIGVIVILLFFRRGVFEMILAMVVATSPLSVIINSWPSKKLLGYSIFNQIRDVASSAVIAIVIMLVLVTESFIPISDYVKFVVQIMTGIVLFVGMSIVIRPTPYVDCLKILCHNSEKWRLSIRK